MARLTAGPDVFTAGVAATLIGVCNNKMRKLIDAGVVRGFRVPGSKHRRVTRAELLRVIAAHNLPVPAELAGDPLPPTEAAR